MRKVKETAQKHRVQNIRQRNRLFSYSPKKKRQSWALGEAAFELEWGSVPRCLIYFELRERLPTSFVSRQAV